jgi:CarboxypepD_reg-like domain
MKNNFKCTFIAGILALCFISVMPAYSGDTIKYVSLSGKLIDKESREPVVFATVYVLGTSIGTVSNSDGEFILKFPSNLKDVKIGIKHIGYKNYSLPLSNMQLDVMNEIKMAKEAVQIKEVVIMKKDPLELLRGAMSRISNNYSTQPVMMTGFYRETVKQNRSYVSIAEGVLNAYKSSYSKILDEDRVKIYKGRKGQDLKKMDTVTFKFQGGPKTTFVLDVVKNPETLLSAEYMAYYDYKLTGVTTFNDKNCYVIEFDQKLDVDNPLFKGVIYIDIDNLAIVGLQFRLSDMGLEKATELLVKKKPTGMKIETLAANYLVNYSVWKDKWYLNYVRSELRFKCKWPRKLFTSNYTIMSEMAITDIDTANLTKFKFSESAKLSDIFTEQVSAFFDPNYWGDYNFIKPDENIQIAIEKLSNKLRRRQTHP